VGNLRERDHLEDLGTDGRIILKWICRKWDVRAWTGSVWLRIGTSCRHLRINFWFSQNAGNFLTS